jgi:hypothetical protein
MARETSNRTYPEIGVRDPHHPLTHHGNDPEKIAKVARINRFHVSLFAGFLEKLKATPEGDGSLLDHSLYLDGSGRIPTCTITRISPSLLLAALQVRCVADGTFATRRRRRWPTFT